MPRVARVFDPGSMLHVLSRANQGEAIFAEQGETRLFLERLWRQGAEWDGRIYAYVVMPNHFHLLLRVNRQPLAALMHPLLSWYAHRYNWRRQKQGHVFQARYQSLPLEREAHLLELVRYIHLNPVRAGLVESPDEYPYSSHSAYCGQKGPAALAAGEALALFSRDRRRAVQQYRQFVKDGMSLGRMPDWYRRRRLGARVTPPRAARTPPQGLGPLARALGLAPSAVFTPGKGSVAEDMALLLHLAIEEAGLTGGEVAALLGCHRSTVRRHLRRAESLRERSPVFRQRLARLARERK